MQPAVNEVRAELLRAALQADTEYWQRLGAVVQIEPSEEVENEQVVCGAHGLRGSTASR